MPEALVVVEVVPDDETAPIFEFGLKEAMARHCPDVSFDFVQRERGGSNRLDTELNIIATRAQDELSKSRGDHCLYVAPCHIGMTSQMGDEQSIALIVVVAGRTQCIDLTVMTFSYEHTSPQLKSHVLYQVAKAREVLLSPASEADCIIASRLMDIVLMGYALALQTMRSQNGNKTELN
jgi:hypothetical protein